MTSARAVLISARSDILKNNISELDAMHAPDGPARATRSRRVPYPTRTMQDGV